MITKNKKDNVMIFRENETLSFFTGKYFNYNKSPINHLIIGDLLLQPFIYYLILPSQKQY